MILYNYIYTSLFQWELLLKERICSQRKRILSFKSSYLRYGKSLLPHKVSSLKCYYFIMHVRILRSGTSPMVATKSAVITLPVHFLHCGRPWPAAYINFNQNIHQIQVLTKPLCRAQAIFIRCRTTSGVPNIVG